MPPTEEYRTRLERSREALVRCELRYRRLGNTRLATGAATLVLAALAIGAGLISAWWLLAPLVAFIVLAIALDRLDCARALAARRVTYWERAIARLENRWIGTGSQGERFRDSKHVYSDDLDLFGRGSLFELLSTCRTAAGEGTLARWLLVPGMREEVLARQQAVAELLPRLDLREELAVMGEDIRAAVDDRTIGEWGARPPVRFFAGARVLAFLLACAAVVTAVLAMAQVLSLRPFLAVVLAELIYHLVAREAVGHVADSLDVPARELKLLGLLLERLEREAFESPLLMALRGRMGAEGQRASKKIRGLERTLEYLDSAHNQFFRPFAALLVWTSQFAMAVESWRFRSGPRIGEWTAAIGEFEALCSLAGFAYERPQAGFPELSPESEPVFEAQGLRHPLIPTDISVANDVNLGGATRLWIVSGSNMSGKSTLLRAIGINAVLAWAGAPVSSARLRVSRVYVGASTRANDSLTDNRSRFYTEIERLRQIVDLARGGLPTLFLLDELLSGTNSHDRQIGAAAVVRGLVERGAIGLLTTHDLALAEIAETLKGLAANVHFEDQLEGAEIHFDYRLRPGIVQRSNALELMRAVGLEV